MIRMRRAIIATYTYAEFAAFAFAWLPILAGARLRHRRDPTHRIAGRWMRRFGKTTSALTPLWRFRVEGQGPPDILRRGYVVVSNHESNADPFLLSWLPWDMRWIAKDEIFRQPVTGWLMHLSGDIRLRRGDRDSVRDMFQECRETLERGLSVMMFPEGTRSKDGELLPFKDGAFQLAIDARAPILPVVLTGTRSCMKKGSFLLHEARATVRVLEPIETDGFGPEDVGRLRDLTRERIRAGLERLRATTSTKRAAYEAEPDVDAAP